MPAPPADADTAPGDTKDAGDVVATREELMRREIDQAMLERNEGEIQHLLTLQETHTKNYRLAREQYAKWGTRSFRRSSSTTSITKSRRSPKVMNELRSKVGEVYGTRIEIPDLDEGDGCLTDRRTIASTRRP